MSGQRSRAVAKRAGRASSKTRGSLSDEAGCVIVFLAAAVAPAQTMKELVKPYLVQALDNGDSFVSVSAASGMLLIAPDSLASIYGSNLAASTALAPPPYPTELGGISVQVVESAGNSQQAPCSMSLRSRSIS